MEVIPVLDLKNGLVVRGIAGRRAEYRPLDCRLVASAEPAAVARALVAHYGFRRAYLADLDAIAGAEPNWRVYEQVAAAGLSLWIDAGVHQVTTAAALAKRAEKVILGLESLPSVAALSELVAAIGPEQAVFSLDLMDGRPLTVVTAWKSQPPATIIAAVAAAGVQQTIVLDLAAVGTNQGPATTALLQTLMPHAPGQRWIGGGGVRDVADLSTLAAAGFDAALVASALYDLQLTTADIETVSQTTRRSSPGETPLRR